MTVISQRSFSGGEITPALYGRVDQVKYGTGLRVCRNWIVARHGGLINRPGTGFIAEVENSSETVKLIPFVFNADQTYVLLFGDLTMRVIKDGLLLREAATVITNTSQTDPVVVDITGHGYSDGDEVFIDNVAGMTELNGRSFLVNNSNPNDFEIQTKDGIDLNGTAFTAYVSGGTAEKVFQIVTPYLEADLPELHYAQSADVVTITHPTYAPRELSRTGDIIWTLTEISFLPLTTHPTGASVAVGAGGTQIQKYKVTAIDPDTAEESLPAVEAAMTITGATQTNPVVITAVAHLYNDDDTVLISGIVGMIELNNRRFTVANQTANTFELKEEDGTGFAAYISGGSAFREDIYTATNADAPTFASPNVISWTLVTGVKEYNVYKASENSYGFLAITDRPSYNDSFAVGDEDVTDTPPADRNPFLFAGNFPSTVTFHQQRRIFANTDNNIEDVFASSSGDFFNFTRRKPIQDNDTVDWNLAGREVNEVQSMIDLNGTLIIMTTAGEWSIGGNSSGVLTPGNINPRQYSFNGSSKVLPILINGTAIYVQDRQNIIRDFGAVADFQNFDGGDLTTFSTHLFENFTITDMTFQQIPHSVGWFVRSDGTLLGLTRMREQDILAWHRHDFENGTVENVVSVPEGTEDAVYVVVKRTIDSKTVRYVERFKARQVVDVEDFVFLDSSITIDGTNTTATTMTVSGGTTWNYDEDLTLTSSVAHFTAADIGNLEIHLRDSLDDIIRFRITAFTSTTIVTVRPQKIVPTTMRDTALTTWGDAVGVIKKIWNLEGEDIGVFGDGFVEASPHNPSHDTVTVSGGEAILDKKYVVIHGGLPITADIETLDVDTIEGETLADKKSLTNQVTLTVKDTRGLWAGTETPVDDDIDEDLMSEFQLREAESAEVPVDLATENIETSVVAEYTEGGKVVIRQVDAVPAEVLSLHGGGFYALRG